MENLIFSLSATVPIFLLMILGIFFKSIGWVDDTFASKMNKFVFQFPLPVLVFSDLAAVNFEEVWDVKFVVFCFVATLISITLVTFISLLWKDKSIRGEFIQVSYRSSAAILGIALIQNIYGTSGMAPLMIIGSVPLYNVMAVLILSFFRPEQSVISKDIIKQALKGIITNPIIIGIVAGLLWSLFKIPIPSIMEKTINSVGSIATPLGLMAMGASFNLQKAFAKAKPAAAAAFIKLIGLCMLFLPIAVFLGFVQEELVAILVMLGSAATVSCFVMAKSMGHDGVLTSGVVMLTTIFSAFTLTGWLFVLKSMNLI